ncbi:YfcL family protein [Glaciecola sp. SC05]|uniref:YfcL family protein n=1 Tax=Glaciecola sp. SC05 TaxID=1987355 RepID=UPI003527C6A2
MVNFSEEQEQYLEQKEAFLDKFIDLDDEYQLFISSYIHGHFSVVAAKLSTAISAGEITPLTDTESFKQYFEGLLNKDIEKAIANQELSAVDAASVTSMLIAMFSSE